MTPSGPMILALETDSAWVVILAVSLVTLVIVGILRRMIGRPGGFASGALLALPLVLPLVAAFAYQQAVLPEIAVLQPAGSALSPKSENLLHLLLVADDSGKGFTPYALAGSAGPWVVLFGAMFSSFMLLRRFAGQLLLRRLVSRSTAPQPGESPDVTVITERLSKQVGLRSLPEVLFLPAGSLGAFATGGRRPKILLSRELVKSLDEAELEAVIAHEVAHVRSRDVQLVAAAGFLRDVVAWNPFAHIAYRKLTRNREFEADRRAAELTRDPLAVASGLVKMCELMKQRRFGRRHALAFLRPGARIRGRVSALLDLSDGGAPALRSYPGTPYAIAVLLAVVLGLQVAARLTSNEGALAIMFGSPASAAERWTGVGAVDTPRGQATKQGKIVSGNGRGAHSRPDARTPFSRPVSIRKPQFSQWKRQMRLAAERRGVNPLLFSRSTDDYEAVPLLPDATGGVGLYRIRQLQ
ncbi:MAG: M56 family metallopeptidase [Actinomycetota bacterium]|nr:M56 family metallopeptidase [Actinomycetota bacterium]